MNINDIRFDLGMIEPGDTDYIPGYYSARCEASYGHLRGSYRVAFPEEQMRDSFINCQEEREYIAEQALRVLVTVVKEERLRL